MTSSDFSSELWIDSYAAGGRSSQTVEVEGIAIHFVYPEAEKHGRQFSYAVYFDDYAGFRGIDRYPLDRRIAVLLETPLRPVVRNGAGLKERFVLIATHWSELICLGAPFAELSYGTTWLGIGTPNCSIPKEINKSDGISFMGSIEHSDIGGYQLRKQVVERLIGDPRVDCFGKGIRAVNGKAEALVPYRYSIAMENTRADWYFTEKLLDCFFTETVPVYWGCPSIGRFFDLRGIIQFEDLEHLLSILDELSPERYEQLRPYVVANREQATENRWHTMHSLHERLGRLILDQLGVREPYTQPRFGRFTHWFRGTITRLARGVRR